MSTGRFDKTPKDGAQRKREHDARKRAAGLKEFRSWATDEEREMLKNALANFRQVRKMIEISGYYNGSIWVVSHRDDSIRLFADHCGNVFHVTAGRVTSKNFAAFVECIEYLNPIPAENLGIDISQSETE